MFSAEVVTFIEEYEGVRGTHWGEMVPSLPTGLWIGVNDFRKAEAEGAPTKNESGLKKVKWIWAEINT